MALESGQRAGDAELWADLSAPTEPRRSEEFDGIMDQALEGVVADALAPDTAAAKKAETEAYEAAIEKAFGGKRGMADIGLPGLVFVTVYTITKDLTPALWSAVGLALLLTAFRLYKRETLQHSIGGLFGVLVCAAVAAFSGRPQDYYLPGLLINVGSGLLCIITALVRWPLVGVMLGPITGEMMTWRRVPGRLRAFTLATWLLAAMFALRLAVQVPLYLTAQTTTLGIARMIMGTPLYVAALYACWQIIKQAPPPVKPDVVDGDGVDVVADVGGVDVVGSTASGAGVVGES